MDALFYQHNPFGPPAGGDLQLTPDGDLQLLGAEQTDYQDATIRLLTHRSRQAGFELSPSVGADLDQFIGEQINEELLRRIDMEATRSLVADKRFPAGTLVKSVPLDQENIVLYVLIPGRNPYKIDTQFSVIRGTDPATEEKGFWLWKRGDDGIQQAYRFWRGWLGGVSLWQLTPEGLTVPQTSTGALNQLGTFTEPLAIFNGGYIFCGKGSTEGLYYPRAYSTVGTWKTERAMQIVGSLPKYDLPDGVWCDEATEWNTVIVINGETAGRYSEAARYWELLAVTEVN